MAAGSELRVAIIGRGFGERVLAPAFRRDPRWNTVAVVSRDWQRVLHETAIDAVAIAVPPFEQSQIAIAALQRNLAVLCEKPLASTLADAERIAANTPENVPAMIDFELPEIPSWRKALGLLTNGEIGTLREITVHWTVQPRANAAPSPWKHNPRLGGGALPAFGSHSLHYLELFGGTISSIRGSVSDTSVHLQLAHESGTASTLLIDTNATTMEHRVQMIGANGTLTLLNETRDYVHGFRLIEAGMDCGGEAAAVHTDGRIDAVAGIARKLADWIETGEPQRPSIADGVRVQQLIEWAEKASR